MKKAADILTEASRLVGGPRNATHGDKASNFLKTVTLWNAYLTARGFENVVLGSDDFPQMMVLAKMARTLDGEFNMDDYLDQAGYSACAGEVAAILNGEDATLEPDVSDIRYAWTLPDGGFLEYYDPASPEQRRPVLCYLDQWRDFAKKSGLPGQAVISTDLRRPFDWACDPPCDPPFVLPSNFLVGMSDYCFVLVDRKTGEALRTSSGAAVRNNEYGPLADQALTCPLSSIRLTYTNAPELRGPSK